jgi:hypothetical protein
MTQRPNDDIEVIDTTDDKPVVSRPQYPVSTTAAPPPQPGRNSRWHLVIRLLMLGITLVIPLTIVTAEVSRYTMLSPIDELQHIDYLLRSPTVIVLGDRIGEAAMREEACRGSDAAVVVPACNAPTLVPDQFQELGFNTASVHPPTYYFLTSVLASPARFLDIEPVTAGRLAGGAWLCLGLLLTWIVGRRLEIDDVALCGTLLLIGVMPSVIYNSSVVNPDAASLPVGAAALMLTLEAERRPSWWRWILLAGAGLVAVAFKTQNIIVIVCLCMYLLLRTAQSYSNSRTPGEPPGRPATRPAVVLGMATFLGTVALLAMFAWLKTTSVIARGSAADVPMSAAFTDQPFPLPELVAALGSFFPPSSAYVSIFLRGPGIQTGTFITGLVVVSCCAGVAWFRQDVHPEVKALARAVTVTAVLGGPLMVLANYLLLGYVFDLPGRYGLALLPLIAICTAAAVRSVAGRGMLATLALAVSVTTLFTIVTTVAA